MLELRRRRCALLAGLARHAAGCIEADDSQLGMHVIGWLPGFDAARVDRLIVAARAQGLGLGLHPVHPCYRVPPPRPGLLLGFAGLFPGQIDEATRILGDCLRALP